MKKIIFGLIATVFMGVLSVNAQDKLQSVDFGFKKVMPTIGDCMDGDAFCVSRNDKPIDFSVSMAALSKVNESTVAVVFSEKFYNENRSNLANGLVVGEPTTIQKDLAQKLGFSKAVTVTPGTYEVRKTDTGYKAEVRIK